MYVLPNPHEKFVCCQFFIADSKATNDLFSLNSYGTSLYIFLPKEETLSVPLYTEFTKQWCKLKFDIALPWSNFENRIANVNVPKKCLSGVSNLAKYEYLSLYNIRKYFSRILFILPFRNLLWNIHTNEQ